MEPIFTESAKLRFLLATASIPKKENLTESREALKESAKTKDGQVVRQYFDCVQKILKNRQEFPTTLPAPLVNETPLQYKRGKRRAMTGLEIAEERERDASRQRRREEHEAAATAAVEERLEAKEKEREEEQEMLAANWLAFSAPADVETDEAASIWEGKEAFPSYSIIAREELIPAPGARAKARALNAKKKKNIEVSQLEDEFELIE
ncbi:hypothetical protein V8E54_014311 [Elaphomyces granulatus]